MDAQPRRLNRRHAPHHGRLPQQERILEPSPYSPASKLFWNEVYLDLERIPELKRCPQAANHLASAAYQTEKNRLRSQSLVDYSAALALKRPVLTMLADEFFKNPGVRQSDFDAFLACSPRATDYAQFRTPARRSRQSSWWVWPKRAPKRRPHGRGLRRGELPLSPVRPVAGPRATRLHATSGRQFGLFLDLPLGICSDSYDVWRERSAFALGVLGRRTTRRLDDRRPGLGLPRPRTR